MVDVIFYLFRVKLGKEETTQVFIKIREQNNAIRIMMLLLYLCKEKLFAQEKSKQIV